MRIEADYAIGEVLQGIYGDKLRYRKGPFGWQQIEADGTPTKYEYPIPSAQMQRYIQAGCVVEPQQAQEGQR